MPPNKRDKALYLKSNAVNSPYIYTKEPRHCKSLSTCAHRMSDCCYSSLLEVLEFAYIAQTRGSQFCITMASEGSRNLAQFAVAKRILKR
jgi:hypothetical protein